MQKYKVFLNEKRIIFQSPGKITFPKPITDSPDFTDIEQVELWLDGFENNNANEMVVVAEDLESTFLNFSNTLLKIDAAGGIVRKNGHLLFIFRNNKWDLPKGKTDKGESPEEGALREVAEECGISGHRITQRRNPSYHIYRSPYKKSFGRWIFKKTDWFEMEYDRKHNGTPETSEGITEVRWFKPDELDEVLANTYENLKELIRSYRF